MAIKQSLLGAVAIVLASGSARAANIIWTTPQNQTGTVADLLTSGTQVAGMTANNTTTYGGVTFTRVDNQSAITLSGMSNLHGDSGNAPNYFDAGYAALADGAAYRLGGTATITVGGLVAGQGYAV